jgi:hypothetical protein
MPIKKALWGFYPIDWRQLSHVIRFERAGGRCETCGRPHRRMISHLGDGRWFDPESEIWRDGQGEGDRLGRLFRLPGTTAADASRLGDGTFGSRPNA